MAANVPELRDFVCALLQQCELNEYVFYVSRAEKSRLQEISSAPNELTINQGQPLPRVVLLTMYYPIRLVFKDLIGEVRPVEIFPNPFGPFDTSLATSF